MSEHAAQQGPTAGEYIGHHLTHLQSGHQSGVIDFSVFNMDSIFWSILLGVAGLFLMWRVAKSVFVAKDAATAKAYATDPNGPYVYYYRSLFTKLKRNGRIELFKTRRDQPDDEPDRVQLEHHSISGTRARRCSHMTPNRSTMPTASRSGPPPS